MKCVVNRTLDMGETLIIPIIDIQKDMKLAVAEGIGTAF